jgi:hypothetical protein
LNNKIKEQRLSVDREGAEVMNKLLEIIMNVISKDFYYFTSNAANMTTG